MNRYKMRAECSADVGRFITQVPVNSLSTNHLSISGLKIPDMEVIFSTALSLDEVRLMIQGIEDGHVMLETVALESEYTGERK